MKLSLVSDSLANLPVEQMLSTAAAAGIQGIEFNTGNWSGAPHIDLDGLLESQTARQALADKLERHNLDLVAFNCNGNQLHPVTGAAHDKVVRDTIRLSGLMGLKTVVLMSGLPAANATDLVPNWITSSWPEENQTHLEWQWAERLLPYWHDLVAYASSCGIEKLAIEMHGNQLVFSPATLMQLRAEVGPMVCANLDPSHLMWMGADAIQSVDYLGDAIAHVHGKDTFINAPVAATRTLLENGPLVSARPRAWTHATIGVGHDLKWWTDFCYRLALVGYSGWVSIEHEDATMSRNEGIKRAVSLLKDAMVLEDPDYQVQSVT
ncbi:sugar phosphate isomerase/epimerase [Rhodobacteraceae bacterium]|nr:sugar phosphate isomerase/epimerase [Paracoccaceae bacterium]